ncbi:MAG: site-specific integrase [Candidatus Nanoarchaeia archaeon]
MLTSPPFSIGISKEVLGVGNKESLEDLSKGQIVNLITTLSKIRKRKYRQRKETKYGNINRGFTDKELKTFFQYCSNKKAYLAFFLMSHLGLRIGEVVKVRLDDIDFVKNKIRISTEKTHTGDFLYLHERVRKLLLVWVQNFQDPITNKKGFILFSSNKKEGREYVSPHWLRKEFRNICKLADLNEFYDYADDKQGIIVKMHGKSRKLYRLTTHSLRHYYITFVYKNCKNPVHTQKLARHRDFKSTQVYIHTSQEDLDGTMKKAFEQEGINAEEGEVEEFAKFWKMWRMMKNEQ